jgi:hypothetical protein
LVILRLGLFHGDAVRVGVGIMAYPGDLPGNLRAGFASADFEFVAGDFFGDIDIWLRLADRCELIAEVAIQRLEIFGQGDPDVAVGVQRRDTVVDVHHVGRFDERVIEIFIGGVEGIVDFE